MNDIVGLFISCLVRSKKYAIEMYDDEIVIIPRINDINDYTNKIVINDVNELEKALNNYINSINNYYKINTIINSKYSVSFFFDILLLSYDYKNSDLINYINNKADNFGINILEYSTDNYLATIDNKDYYYRVNPFSISFYTLNGNKKNEFSSINYIIDEDCCIIDSVNKERKSIIIDFNNHNIITSLSLMFYYLNSININKIIIPTSLLFKNSKTTRDEKNDNKIEIIKKFYQLFNKLNIEIDSEELFECDNNKYACISLKNKEIFIRSKNL